MRPSHHTAQLIRSMAGCLLLLTILVPDAKAQRRRGGSDLPRIGLYGGAIYTGAFGGTGGGFQFSASVPIPVSALGAQYTAGIQFSYSQPSRSGITVVGAQRQLYGYGGYAMATWSLGGHVFPYVRIPVQGITSVVPTPTVGVTGAPPQAENTPGPASSLAIGIGGGLTVPVGGAFSVYGGATTLAHRLYSSGFQPIWSLEFGIILSPGTRATAPR